MLRILLASLLVLQVFSQTTTTYLVNLTNTGSGSYVFFVYQGSNSLGPDPTLTANVGDTLIFNVTSASDVSAPAFAIHTNSNNLGLTSARYGNNTSVSNGLFYVTIGSDAPSTLYYVDENSNAFGAITISFNCMGLPNIANTVAGSCSSDSTNNNTSCTPTCTPGYTSSGDLTATCVNGVFQTSGTCTLSSGSATGSGSSNDNSITYIFKIDGTCTQNCNYVKNTVLPNLNDWGNGEFSDISNVYFNANVSSCNDNNNNSRKRQSGGSTFEILAYVSGSNADNAVQSDAFFANLIQLQLESDNSVTVNNINVQRNSGLVMQVSVIALLSVVLTALMA